MQIATRLPGRVLAMVLLGAGLVAGFAALRTIPASATAPCIAHGNTSEEQEFLQIHQTWRNEYIQYSDPSNPLQVSATLNASAMAYASFMADHPGATGHAADGAGDLPWAERARLCGYPADLAVGGEAMSLVLNAPAPVSPAKALDNMTSEVWGAAIRIPANLNGLPMRCIGVAHARSEDGVRDVWIAVIMAGSGPSCPQQVIIPTPTPAAGFPIKTNTPTPKATPTPKGTPTKAVPPSVYQVRLQVVASDGD